MPFIVELFGLNMKSSERSYLDKDEAVNSEKLRNYLLLRKLTCPSLDWKFGRGREFYQTFLASRRMNSNIDLLSDIRYV